MVAQYFDDYTILSSRSYFFVSFDTLNLDYRSRLILHSIS